VYHRIASVLTDPWDLAVSPLHFEQHLALLQKKFRVISLPELIHQLKTGSIKTDSVCITFDDGYADNFHTAKPLLERHAVPATFFIPTENLLQQKSFWWDDLEEIFLHKKELPATFCYAIGGQTVTANLENETLLTPSLINKQNAWRWPAAPPSKRCELYLALWEHLKPLNLSAIETELASIKNLLGVEASFRPGATPMTLGELQELASHSLFEIGLHTHTHPALASHSREVQMKEFVENKNALQNYCDPLNAVAFPYGNYNTVTLEVVQQLKLAVAFSTAGSPVVNKSNPFYLGRFQVYNWDSRSFENFLLDRFRNT
jgi:peptidoglycan/xylan/chitin deacetylase (PgdA/CDA1 family)